MELFKKELLVLDFSKTYVISLLAVASWYNRTF
jgi:hypothetical protein